MVQDRTGAVPETPSEYRKLTYREVQLHKEASRYAKAVSQTQQGQCGKWKNMRKTFMHGMITFKQRGGISSMSVPATGYGV